MTEARRIMNKQYAPYPTALEAIVDQLTYRPGWHFQLADEFVRDRLDAADTTSAPLAQGLTFIVTTKGYDSYHVDQGEHYRVNHFFIVPAATYSYDSWLRWVFECLAKVELHECMEFFQVAGGRPFAPNHSPGEDPYVVHELTTQELRDTSYLGVRRA